MNGLREAFQSKIGKSFAVVLTILAGCLVFYSIRSNMGASGAAAMSRDRIFVDSATGKPFGYQLKDGDSIPVKAPSGGQTGYPSEACYWTPDGLPKDDPDYVILNSWLGKPGPTFCPVCGRLVVMHNPAPMEGKRPPPTSDQYLNRR